MWIRVTSLDLEFLKKVCQSQGSIYSSSLDYVIRGFEARKIPGKKEHIMCVAAESLSKDKM